MFNAYDQRTITYVEVINGGIYNSDHYEFNMQENGDMYLRVKDTSNGIFIPSHQIALIRYTTHA